MTPESPLNGYKQRYTVYPDNQSPFALTRLVVISRSDRRGCGHATIRASLPSSCEIIKSVLALAIVPSKERGVKGTRCDKEYKKSCDL
jgi:hypothetical protein